MNVDFILVELSLKDTYLDECGSFTPESMRQRAKDLDALKDFLWSIFDSSYARHRVVLANEAAIPFQFLPDLRRFAVEANTHLIVGAGYVPRKTLLGFFESRELIPADRSLLVEYENDGCFNVSACITPERTTYITPKIEKSRHDKKCMIVPRMESPPIFVDPCGILNVYTVWTCLDVLQPMERLLRYQGKIDVLLVPTANKPLELHTDVGRYFRYPGYCFVGMANNLEFSSNEWGQGSGLWAPSRKPIDVRWCSYPHYANPTFRIGRASIDTAERRDAVLSHLRKDWSSPILEKFYRPADGFLDRVEFIDEIDQNYYCGRES